MWILLLTVTRVNVFFETNFLLQKYGEFSLQYMLLIIREGSSVWKKKQVEYHPYLERRGEEGPI